MPNEHQGEGDNLFPSPDPIAYNEIARAFFNEFLELRDQIRSGGNPLTLEKELHAERRKALEFKRLVHESASRNEALELVMESMEKQAADLRRQLNEALFEVARLQELNPRNEGAGGPMVDRLSDRSKSEFAKLLTQKPSTNPNRKDEE